MATYSKSFTALGASEEVTVDKGNSVTYAVSGTFVGTWQLQRCTGKGFMVLATGTGSGSGTVTAERNIRLRFTCSAFTSGTIVTSVVDQVAATTTRRIVPAATAKAGATAGWVVAAANNTSLATCPASITSGTLVVPAMGLRVGECITGFYAVGQIESAGNTATLNISLRKMTAAAADVSDALVASITALSVTADTIISASNARATDFVEEIGADESFYFLVTATTGVATDFALQALVLEVVTA